MTESERGYLAALIDRGYVGITKSGTGLLPIIMIQCDRKVIDWLVDDLKIGKRQKDRNWHSYVSELERIFNEVEPYLKVKHEHIKLLRRYLIEYSGIRGKRLTDEQIKVRNELYLESRKLNAGDSGSGTKSKKIRIHKDRVTKC